MAIDPGGTPIAAQDAGPDGVEGAHPDTGGAQPQQLLDSRPHLAGRLVGERHGQDLAGSSAALLDQPGDPVREDSGLAAAGAGKDQQRPIARRHRGALRGIERGQDIQVGSGLGDRRWSGGHGRDLSYLWSTIGARCAT